MERRKARGSKNIYIEFMQMMLAGNKKEMTEWKCVKIEEVKKFEYLGFIMQVNEEHGTHIRYRIKKAVHSNILKLLI